MIGWAAGVLSTVLGALAFGAVLCLWFPAVLTTPALRDVYPMDLAWLTGRSPRRHGDHARSHKATLEE